MRWHNDISDIVGQGPRPGRRCKSHYKGFSASSAGSSIAVVKFACPKGAVEVTGDLLGDDVIVSSAPDFSSCISDEQVRVTVKVGPN